VVVPYNEIADQPPIFGGTFGGILKYINQKIS